MTHTKVHDRHEILKTWERMQKEDRPPRSRDAAARMGISEMALVDAKVGSGATRLRNEPQDILRALESCGTVLALSRNDSVVIEKVGVYERLSFRGHMAQALGDHIDLRLYFHAWKSAYWVEVPTRRGPRESLQFFDDLGDAIHKVYPTEETDTEVWGRIRNRFAAGDEIESDDDWARDRRGSDDELARDRRELDERTGQTKHGDPDVDSKEPPARRADTDTAAGRSDVDIDSFRRAWDALEDTHGFFALLRTHELDRLEALRLAGVERARPVPASSYQTLLRNATATDLSLLVFVGNRGIHQIHAGPVRRTVPTEGWFNVMDPGFNLHVQESGIAAAWWVRKPTRAGFVHSLELYDPSGRDVAFFFSKKDRTQPESEAWRTLLETSIASS